jgi:hypothetical protein
LDDLHKKEQEMIQKMEKREEKDWKHLKEETKQLLSKKEKDLEHLYDKETSLKESELSK